MPAGSAQWMFVAFAVFSAGFERDRNPGCGNTENLIKASAPVIPVASMPSLNARPIGEFSCA
jgi:hypothetical protein